MSKVVEEDSWIFDSLINFLQGPIWKLPVLNFIEEKSVVFDPDSYQNSLTDEKEGEFLKIHDEYKGLVDYMLSNFMDDMQITPGEVEADFLFMLVCRSQANSSSRESTVTKLALEQLWAAEDFNAFRRLMTRKNIDLQLQSLELLVSKYGVLSPALRSGTDETGPEDDFLQVVMRYCDTDELFRESNPGLFSGQSKTSPQNASSPGKNLYEKSESCKASSSSPAAKKVSKKSKSNAQSLPSQDPMLPQSTNQQRLKELEIGEEGDASGAAMPSSNPGLGNPGEETKFAKVKIDKEKLAKVAPIQHKMLSDVRRALEIHSPTDENPIEPFPSSESKHPGNDLLGTDEEIERRREYLRAQRDKLVALKRAEREKQLSAVQDEEDKLQVTGHSKAGGSRPKSARAAQMAIKSPESLKNANSQKSLAARKALAECLKKELIDN